MPDQAESTVSLTGVELSHDRIIQKRGGGGMGVVYEAEDTRLHRHVSLKFLPDNLAKNPEALARFQREAQAASALNHPNICTIYDVGEVEGKAFIAMEYLEGATLKSRIAGRPMEMETLLNLSIEVTATLELMTLPPGSKLTPEVARELYRRANSKAYITGTISRLGSENVLGLRAVNCQNGDTLAQTQVTATAKEKVLDGLGNAASQLRQELGESLAAAQKYDVSPEQATTPSLEALRTLSLGIKLAREKGLAATLPFDQRGIQTDPNFAMACMHMRATYFTLGQVGRASDYFAKAFELHEHASERERLEIFC